MHDHDGLCPKCNGSGTKPLWDFGYQDWIEVFCFTCNGTGTLTALPTEEEASQSAYQLAGGKRHAEKDPRHGREVLAFDIPCRSLDYDQWLDSLR